MDNTDKTTDARFKKEIMKYYRQNGRHDLPWRHDTSPYSIVVSEIMLQQTQVARVIEFYNKWMKMWPSFCDLASAELHEVLKVWKGLGYNIRAIRLHKLSKEIIEKYNGVFPCNFEDINKLSGIGPYTAGAIMNFSYKKATSIIETNIRRVYIHHYFYNKQNIDDKVLCPVIMQTMNQANPQVWFWALMDYGSSLPKILKFNANRQSKHYTKQSKFQDSDRFFRSKILSTVVENKLISIEEIFSILGNDKERSSKIVNKMIKENILTDLGGKYVLNES